MLIEVAKVLLHSTENFQITSSTPKEVGGPWGGSLPPIKWIQWSLSFLDSIRWTVALQGVHGPLGNIITRAVKTWFLRSSLADS